MVLEENAVVADRGAEANPTGLKDQDQKAEQEGKTFLGKRIINSTVKTFISNVPIVTEFGIY